MAVGIIMPRQGQSVESCIIEWKVKEGDNVKAGDVLFGYETDKASFEEMSAADGTVLKQLYQDGDDVPCLKTVCVIGQPGEDISALLGGDAAPAQRQPEESKPVISKAEDVAPVTPGSPKSEAFWGGSTASAGDALKISPRAKAEAARQNLDVTKAVPTGPNGRIIERDIAVLAEKGYRVTAAAAKEYAGGIEGSGLGGAVTTADMDGLAAAVTNARPADAPAFAAAYTDVKLSNVRKAIAKSMHASLSEMAQLTNNASFDATAILAYRERIKAGMDKLGLPNITLNDVVLYAVSRVLKKHPGLNAHYLEDRIRQFSSVNLGMAVDTPRGLLVPTMFGADTLSLSEIAAQSKSLAAAAQSGSISPDLLTGGTFTVTNLGALGIESFTPVINPPQTAILGVCAITYRLNKGGGVYPAMGLSLTFDHRAVDGAPAARFLKDLCAALESFDLLLAM